MLVCIESIGEFAIPVLLYGLYFNGWKDTLTVTLRQTGLAVCFGSEDFHTGCVGNWQYPFS